MFLTKNNLKSDKKMLFLTGTVSVFTLDLFHLKPKNSRSDLTKNIHY